MKRLYVAVIVGACGVSEPPLESQVDSPLTETQGTDYQGTDYQGTDYQGTDYQGTDYQGTDYQGTDYQGNAYGEVIVNATSIETWNQLGDQSWEQRTPNQVCQWDATRTSLLAPCAVKDLTVSPSPLAGTLWPATFTKVVSNVPVTITGTIRIGLSPTEVGAVRNDTSLAMHPLDGTPATSCQASTELCASSRGCRRNCDLFTYKLWLLTADGQDLPFCHAGATAYVLPGTWDATGQYSSTSGKFTFACSNGTIAKCTRWGYRPWSGAQAKKSDNTSASTAEYHQACVRAATADYCSNGHSFTKNGTLVDIYDYGGEAQSYLPTVGFIPRVVTTGDTGGANTTFLWESTFDPIGAATFDHLRYDKLTQIEDPTFGCTGRFVVMTHPYANVYRSSLYGGMQPVRVAVSNSTSCQHSEQTIGRALDPRCNRGCSTAVWQTQPHCLDPNDSRGWDQSCVTAAAACKNGTSTAPMAIHSECSTGSGLTKLDSACTFAVCSQAPGCCTGSFFPQWTSSCVTMANAICKGGRETQVKGFCGTSVVLGNGG
jgi:hypothetical protein